RAPVGSPMQRSLFLCVFALGVGLGLAGCDDDRDRVDGGIVVPGSDGGGGSCTPTTCEELAIDCGEALDGCGGRLLCGRCAEGETCGAGGPNVCAAGDCVPTTCEALAAECGLASDRCAAVLDCGGCASGICSTALTCCAPTSCAAEGASCGAIPDGCGHTLDCGGGPSGETWGAGGPNLRGGGTCAPRTCAG